MHYIIFIFYIRIQKILINKNDYELEIWISKKDRINSLIK